MVSVRAKAFNLWRQKQIRFNNTYKSVLKNIYKPWKDKYYSGRQRYRQFLKHYANYVITKAKVASELNRLIFSSQEGTVKSEDIKDCVDRTIEDFYCSKLDIHST